MKNVSKHGKQALATLFLLFGLMVFCFSETPGTDCDCSSPTVTLTGQTSTSVSFSWSAIPDASGYRAWYIRQEDSFTSQPTTASGTSISFSNLVKGTYKFYFVTVCGEETSQIIITDDLIMG